MAISEKRFCLSKPLCAVVSVLNRYSKKHQLHNFTPLALFSCSFKKIGYYNYCLLQPKSASPGVDVLTGVYCIVICYNQSLLSMTCGFANICFQIFCVWCYI